MNVNLNGPGNQKDGIFAVPIEQFMKDAKCFSTFYIGHNRDHLGYTGDWYDAIDMDEELHRYRIEIPKKEGTTLYFSVETYYQNIIPNECTTGVYKYTNIMDQKISVELQNPLLYYALFKNADKTKTDFKMHAEQFTNPIEVIDYKDGDVFEIDVQYWWFGSPARDYTVKVYSKEALQISNKASGKTNQLYTDGTTTPSEFVLFATKSDEAQIDKKVIKSLADLFYYSEGFGDFLWLFA